jgi:large subunit ribosomal protein L10
MKTKAQKTKKVEEGGQIIEGKNTVVFADFTGTKVNDVNALRKTLHDLESKFEVFKKRLFRVALQQKGFEFNPETLPGQLGVIYTNKRLDEIAGPVYKFAKQFKTFKILGGINLKEKQFVPGNEVEAIGQLPPREVLIAQVVGTIAAPMSAFLYVLSERSKQLTK